MFSLSFAALDKEAPKWADVIFVVLLFCYILIVVYDFIVNGRCMNKKKRTILIAVIAVICVGIIGGVGYFT